jgi:hypothetical protein
MRPEHGQGIDIKLGDLSVTLAIPFAIWRRELKTLIEPARPMQLRRANLREPDPMNNGGAEIARDRSLGYWIELV